MLRVALVTLCLLAGLSQTSLATYGTGTATTDSAVATVTITGCGSSEATAPNVSGTFVEIGIGFGGVGTKPDPPVPDEWEGAWLTSWSLTIGGQAVTLPTVPSYTTLRGHTIRFASTKFQSGTDANVELTAHFVWIRETYPGSGTFIQSSDQTVSASAKVHIWNKGLLLSTQEVFLTSPSPGHFSKPGDSDYPNPLDDNSPPEVATRIATLAKSFLTDTKHEKPQPKEPWEMRQSDLEPLWQVATMFICCTHASIDWIRACNTDEMTNDYIGQHTYENSRPHSPTGRSDNSLKAPPYNIAIAYACSVANGTFRIKLDVDKVNTFWLDRCFIGQDLCLFSTGYDSSDNVLPLDVHADALFKQLLAGQIARRALEEANTACCPLSPDKLRQPMLLRGDSFSRLINVYQSVAETGGSNIMPINSWYWVKPS